MTAVDEMDRLNGIIECTPQAVRELINEIKRLRADNERLTAVLKDIAGDDYLPDGIRAIEIARRALERKP